MPDKCLSVNIGNYSKTFQEILTRGSGYTLYIDEVGKELVKYIGRIEDKNIR